jgi:hypothetical protein
MQVLDGAAASLEAEVGILSAAELYKRILPFAGMGPFTAANVLQLLGLSCCLDAALCPVLLTLSDAYALSLLILRLDGVRTICWRRAL